MKIKSYLKEKNLSIIISICFLITIILILKAFKIRSELTILISVMYVLNIIIFIVLDYLPKKKFYDYYLGNLEKVDKKYLIQEIINKPSFYEGKILFDSLYEINKSMIEEINEYKLSINEFKEYVEIWIHEVKIPISSLILINHNDNKNNKKYSSQINILDNYIDQILYYVRSENVEKDFTIKETKLDKTISNVALKNKDIILENNIELETNTKNIKVLTDSKWLEFIINQIVNNSIKYKNDTKPKIIITAKEKEDKIILTIYDNGIGIPSNDISRVFEKSFTGENGRTKSKSTGMGLYIVKKLCDKLGHNISIQSKIGEYTSIDITFKKNDFYKIK